MRINVNHTKACKLCTRGVRKFLIDNGFDFKVFCEEGIDEEILRSKLNDHRLEMVIKFAHGEK